MNGFPHWLAHRLRLLNKPFRHIYCRSCRPRNDGRGVFLAYYCEGYLLIPISKGRGRIRWQTIQRGGICCDDGHYTYIDSGGQIVTIDSKAENVGSKV